MKINRCLLLIGITLLFTTPHFSQNCGFAAYKNKIVAGFERTYYWDVEGAEFNDLSSPEQGVCMVEIHFSHSAVNDLQVSLISPAGQIVQLIQVEDENAPGKKNQRKKSKRQSDSYSSLWTIKFASCSDRHFPDAGLSANFGQNNWPKGVDFWGTYYPSGACLEHFNVGPVNGRWELKLSSRAGTSTGVFYGFKIDFWKNAGIYCNEMIPVVDSINNKNNFFIPDLNSSLSDKSKGTYDGTSDLPSREKAVKLAEKLLKKPYLYGGQDTTGFDCSGFTAYVLGHNGIDISPASAVQSQEGRPVEFDQVQPGDLIFFGSTKDKIDHVGMVVKRDQEGITCIHSTSSRGVIKENVTQSKYWKPRMQFARNVILPQMIKNRGKAIRL